MRLISVAAGHQDAQLQTGAGIAASRMADLHDPTATLVATPATRKSYRSVLRRNHVTKSSVLVALLCSLLVSGCAARGVRIAELRDQPAKYGNKSVSVSGVVTRSWGIPLVPFQLYNVDDGSGEITVVASGGRTPTRGARVKVTGRLNEVAVFGGQSIGLHLREQDRKIN